MPRVRFLPDEQVVEARPDESLLEAALRAGIPHAHACGGHARCSTCRVLVLEGLAVCSPRTPAEVEVADRTGFGEAVRLACQTRVGGDVTVRRLVVDDTDLGRLDLRVRPAGQAMGREREVTVLFADLRGFTPFAAGLLPYDVIDVLDRFADDAVHTVEERHGGRLTAFLGDGVMAVFGADGEADPAGQGVAAGLELIARFAERRKLFGALYGADLEVNVGIHHGPAVVGEIRWRGGRSLFTAVGETVNLAQRIEQANKLHSSQLLVSATVADLLGTRLVKGRELEGSLRGTPSRHRLVEVLGLVGASSPAV